MLGNYAPALAQDADLASTPTQATEEPVEPTVPVEATETPVVTESAVEPTTAPTEAPVETPIATEEPATEAPVDEGTPEPMMRLLALGEIDGAITSLVFDLGPDNELGYYESATLIGTWSVPDEAASGDYFTITLPEEMNFQGRDFDVLTPDGSAVVARATVSGTVVTFTLTEYADNNNVPCTLLLSAYSVQSTISGDERENEHTFSFGISIDKTVNVTAPLGEVSVY